MKVTQGVFKNTNVYGMDFIDKYVDIKSILTNGNYISKFSNDINSTTSQTSTIMSDDHTYYNICENTNLINCNIETGRFINCIITGNSGVTNYINDGYFSGCTIFNYIINNGIFIDCDVDKSNEWNDGFWQNDNTPFVWTKPWIGVWNSGVFDNPYGWLDGIFNGGTFNSSVWSGGTINGGYFSGTLSPTIFLSGLFRYGDFQNCIFKDGVFNGGTYSNSEFNGGFINGGDFSDILLSGNTKSIIINDGDFYNCSVNGNTDIKGGNFDTDDYLNYNIINANVYNGNIVNMLVSGGNFYNGTYQNMIFNNGDIYNGNYTNIYGYNSLVIHNGAFRNSTFTGLTIKDGNFTNCYSTGCTFKYGVYTDGDMFNCRWYDGYWNDGEFTTTVINSGISNSLSFNVATPTTTTTTTMSGTTTTTTTTLAPTTTTTTTTLAPTTTTTTTTSGITITINSITRTSLNNLSMSYNMTYPAISGITSYSTSSGGTYIPINYAYGNNLVNLYGYNIYPNAVLYFKLTAVDNPLNYDISDPYDNTTITLTAIGENQVDDISFYISGYTSISELISTCWKVIKINDVIVDMEIGDVSTINNRVIFYDDLISGDNASQFYDNGGVSWTFTKIIYCL